MTYTIIFVVSYCSIVYELLLAQSLTNVVGNSVLRYSITIGFYLFSLGIGSVFCKIDEKTKKIDRLIVIEIFLSIVGGISVIMIYFLDVFQKYLHNFSQIFGKGDDSSLAIESVPWIASTIGVSGAELLFFILSSAVVMVIGFLSGFELPTLISIRNDEKSGTMNKVLGTSYLGALVGSVMFPIFLKPVLDVFTIAFYTASINIVAALLIIIFKKRKILFSHAIPILIIIASLTYGFTVVNSIHQSFLKKFYFFYDITNLGDLFDPMDGDIPESFTIAEFKTDLIPKLNSLQPKKHMEHIKKCYELKPGKIPTVVSAKTFNARIYRKLKDDVKKVNKINFYYSKSENEKTYKLKDNLTEEDKTTLLELFRTAGFNYSYKLKNSISNQDKDKITTALELIGYNMNYKDVVHWGTPYQNIDLVHSRDLPIIHDFYTAFSNKKYIKEDILPKEIESNIFKTKVLDKIQDDKHKKWLTYFYQLSSDSTKYILQDQHTRKLSVDDKVEVYKLLHKAKKTLVQLGSEIEFNVGNNKEIPKSIKFDVFMNDILANLDNLHEIKTLNQYYKLNKNTKDTLRFDLIKELRIKFDEKYREKFCTILDEIGFIDVEKNALPDDLWLFLNGKYQFFSLVDEIYHEWFVHVPIICTQVPKHALILGGGDGMVARELLKYKNIESITQIELDSKMIEISKNHPLMLKMNDGSFNNPRLNLIQGDAFSHLKYNNKKYDAIYIDFPNPDDFNLSILYSVEFYTLVRHRLTDIGFAVFDSPGGVDVNEMDENDENDENYFTIYYNTLKTAGYKTIIPFFTILENDNPELVKMRREKMSKLKDEESMYVPPNLWEHWMDEIGNIEQSFIMITNRKGFINREFRDDAIKLHILNEKRFKLAISKYSTINYDDMVNPKLANSIFKPTLPFFNLFDIVYPY